MNTIDDKLTYLEDTKEAIKTALTAKGVKIKDSDTFRSYADKINSISANPFSVLGYDETPEGVINDINYSKEIMDNWDATQTDLSNKFAYKQFKYMPLVDTSNVTNMSSMFKDCRFLVAISQFDTSNVTDMSSMFSSCGSLTTIPQLDTVNVTDMSNMFYQCGSLTAIPQLNTSNVTNMHYMFYICPYLITIPHLDTSKVTDMESMFHWCRSLTTIPLLDTSKVTNMSWMFNGCHNLTVIPQLNTVNVINMSWMFDDCSSLTTILQLNTSNVTDMSSLFNSCSSLAFINILNLGTQPEITDIDFSTTIWGDDSKVEGAKQSLIDSLINNSFDRAKAGYTPCRILLSTTTKGFLTEAEKKSITDKGYTLA